MIDMEPIVCQLIHTEKSVVKKCLLQCTYVNEKYTVSMRTSTNDKNHRTTEKSYLSKKYALNDFANKFYTKTGNQWDIYIDSPESFIVDSEKYYPHDAMVKEMTVSDFIADITSIEYIKKTLKDEYDYDVSSSKFLRNINNMQIASANIQLNFIKKILFQSPEDVLKSGITAECRNSQLQKLSNNFCNIIPIGSIIIDDVQKLMNMYELLDVMKNIKKSFTTSNLNITHVNRKSDTWNNIQLLIERTRAPTHKYNLDVLDIFEIDDIRKDDDDFCDAEPHRMLFHGTKKINIGSILKDGIKIPVEDTQVINGCVLGKGIYFADSSTKSFNYSINEKEDEGYVLLCEVALGKNVDIVYKIKTDIQDIDSRIAIGRYKMINEQSLIIDYKNNLISAMIGNYTKSNTKSNFLYNEYVIYNTNRYRLRYIVRLKKS